MSQDSVPALDAPLLARDNPLTRSVAGVIGMAFLGLMIVACLGSLPWTLGSESGGAPRYNAGTAQEGRLPPLGRGIGPDDARRLNGMVDEQIVAEIAAAHGISPADAVAQTQGQVATALREHWSIKDHPFRLLLGTDPLGRSLLYRCLTGGGISLGIGIAAALLSVFIGTMYGAISGYAGGKTDAVMMRIVDVLYGLPYILLVVLLAVAVDASVEDWQVRRVAAGAAPLGSGQRQAINVMTLLVAIGGVSWLTMARVVRGQVLSLKNQPFMEAARAIGVPLHGQFFRHLLPNLLGPIIVYATLTVPQAILQESFLSFLGIGVQPPLPSWGNLAADGLSELNTYKSHWWLLLFPCVLLGLTLLALNFVGEGLREAFDPKRARR